MADTKMWWNIAKAVFTPDMWHKLMLIRGRREIDEMGWCPLSKWATETWKKERCEYMSHVTNFLNQPWTDRRTDRRTHPLVL